MSNKVTPKKHLGQHFLIDLSISEKIADAITLHKGYKRILEIGPGTASLTQFLLKNDNYLTEVVEIDRESIAFLGANYPDLKVYTEDFLKMNFDIFNGEQIAIIGNFPYNISSQIMFKVLEEKDQIPEVVGMFQKEVAERIAEKPGSKKYGITSVLLQAYYDIEYLFTVEPEVFDPPPKVKSGVIRLRRNDTKVLDCDEKLFKTIIKMAFNQRRKTVRNSIKSFIKGTDFESEFLSERPEQMSVADFVKLTNQVEKIL
ncbi:MAG: 16S rRNA (adenine1518-N6/adenine1519-N6)-dimethyltransferase [Parvicella sp.]|jgi:16S rRNA (adenine1518-N6/adenine1519-N6)-dimethyltransferase